MCSLYVRSHGARDVRFFAATLLHGQIEQAPVSPTLAILKVGPSATPGGRAGGFRDDKLTSIDHRSCWPSPQTALPTIRRRLSDLLAIHALQPLSLWGGFARPPPAQ